MRNLLTFYYSTDASATRTLPAEQITPDTIFERVGLDYAGPFLLKYGPTQKPTIVKAYICVFVSLTVKVVHLELIPDLTTNAFIAGLR